MRTMKPGAHAPDQWLALACGLLLLAVCMLGASASAWVPHLSPLFSTELRNDPDAVLPAPARFSFRGTHTTKISGVDAPLRIRLETSVPADLGDVLAFYRKELTSRDWQEQPDGAAVAPGHVHLAFVSPLGPAALDLRSNDGSTSVELVQRNQEAAFSARVMPRAGQGGLMFSNLGDKEIVVTLDSRAVTLPARIGERPQAPFFNVAPGEHIYALQSATGPDRDIKITVAAGDAWEVTVGPNGAFGPPMQLY